MIISQVNGKVITFSTPGGTLPAESTTVSIQAGIQGFQDLDLDVGTTALVKGNYHMFGSGGPRIPAAQALGPDSLPNSLFRPSKPSYFGDLAWPAFDPLDPAPAYTRIPAGVRFVNRTTSAPGPSGNITAQAPTNVKILRQ